jgi:hypothetical protein
VAPARPPTEVAASTNPRVDAFYARKVRSGGAMIAAALVGQHAHVGVVRWVCAAGASGDLLIER